MNRSRSVLASGLLLALSILPASAVPLSAQSHPKIPIPSGVPITADRVELGRKLFFDERLSINGTVSCATCHDPARGFSDGRQVAVGVFGRTGTMNSPTIINASYSPLQFWDGRTVGQPTQALQPIVNPQEMGGQSEGQVLNRLRRIPGYVALFNRAYGFDRRQNTAVTREAYGHALASFETTIVSFDAPVDRRLAGDLSALSPEAEIGFGLFVRANCMACHKPPLFTDLAFHNDGSEFAGKFQPNDDGRFTVIRGLNVSRQDRIASVRAFKTPTLREIARTAPYNHAGTFATLRRVLEHYNSGGAKLNAQGAAVVDAAIDRRIRPLGFNSRQLEYLETFLVEGFSSPNYPLVTRPVLP